MINALVTGKVIVAPAERTAKRGKNFYTTTVSASTGGEESCSVSAIVFNQAVGKKLMALSKGDAVSLVGKVTPKIYTGKDGVVKASLDMVADECLTAYQVTQKRKAATSESAGTTPPQGPQSSTRAAPQYQGDIADDLPWQSPRTDKGKLTMTNSPIFDYLFSRYKEMRGNGQSETEAGRLLFVEMMHYAPPEYLAVANQVADEMNLIPEPDGYTDNGTPMIGLSALAKHHGLSMDEAGAMVERFMADRESLGLSNAGIVKVANNIHRKH
jgi:single-stranded DNA-binding protein